ncbi:MAG: hypothetical protein ACOC3G_03190 [Phycisphaeraceae bacterium]
MFEVADVAGVDHVEAAVAVHDPPAGGAMVGGELGEPLEGHDLAVDLQTHTGVIGRAAGR